MTLMIIIMKNDYIAGFKKIINRKFCASHGVSDQIFYSLITYIQIKTKL
jgi:hypothetical protein